MVAKARPTLSYETLAESRSHLPAILDAAQDGLMVTLARGRSRRHAADGTVSVVKTDVLLGLLERIVADSIEADFNADDELHTVGIRGLPLATEAEQLGDAVAELVGDIRDYCDDWVERLRFVSNHAGNVPLVYLAQSMDDDDLQNWIVTQTRE